MSWRKLFVIVALVSWAQGSDAGQATLLEKGQYLRVRIKDELKSERAKPGDRFSAELGAPLLALQALPAGKKIALKPGATYRARTEVKSSIEFPAKPGMMAQGWLTIPAGRQFTLERMDLQVRIVKLVPSTSRKAFIDINQGELLEGSEVLPEGTAMGGKVIAVSASGREGPVWIEVEFDQVRARDGRFISMKGKLMEVLPSDSPRLDTGGRFRSAEWEGQRCVFLGGEQGTSISCLVQGQVPAGRGEVKVRKGTEAGVVLVESAILY